MNNNASIPLLSTSSIRTQSLEEHVHKWIDFSVNFIQVWQKQRHDTRKIKLKKIRFSNQSEKILLEKLPRIVDMFFEVKDDMNENKLLMSFCEESTTIRLILCTYSSVTSIEQQETKDFDLINKETVDKNVMLNKMKIPCINNMNINDINAFICIQPSEQIQKNNCKSQPLFKLIFDD